MKKEFLSKSNVRVRALLLVFLICLCPGILKAQPNYEEDGYVSQGVFKTMIGTPDSRMMASIYETDTSVTMLLSAVGYMKANMLSFAFFYDPYVLRLADQSFEPIEEFDDLQGHSAVLSPDLTTKGWHLWGSHKKPGTSFILSNVSGHQSMRAIWYDMAYSGINPNNLFQVDSGKVQHILYCTFKKQITSKPLENEDIGIGVKTTVLGSGLYQPKFGYDGLFLWYRQTTVSNDNRIINPELFLFRSGSTVKTESVSDPGPSFATLNGSFTQGTLPISETILDTTGTVRTGTGRLHHDIVGKYGFIYSLADVDLTIDDFSNLLKIGSDTYPVPTAGEIAAKTFTRGSHLFHIEIVDDNEGTLPSLNYNKTVTGLLPQENYYVWAYKQYSFETSDVFQSVGNRIPFVTDHCIALNIGTVFTVTEPLCGQPTGEIQVFVTGGSGSYEFSVNGGEFKAYTDDIINELSAGTYSITVRDAIQSTCPETTVDNIVLHNAVTDLHIVASSSEATTCESLTGTLYVSVTGGNGPFTFYLNGEVEPVTNGEINNLKAGVYVVNVMDNSTGCVASSGEVRITSEDSDLLVVIDNHEDTQCGESTGAVTFTITGSANFNYQLDGFPIGTGSGEKTVELTGLTAGEHILRVWDDCNEIKNTVTITNGTDALAFTVESVNEILDCYGVLTLGSITLNVTDGTPLYKYSINGADWTEFPTSSGIYTIPELATGTYRVEVIDDNDCKYEINKIAILHETSFGTQIMPPLASSPQTFCSGATVANLQATGVGVKWYTSEAGGEALSSTEALVHDVIYYASQIAGTCESTERTAVKVIINNELVLTTPNIASPQELCNDSNELTLADIATDGNTNIVWYELEEGGDELPLHTLLEDKTYYAAIKTGSCQSASRLPVEISFTDVLPIAVDVTSPQKFCEGALIGNIEVPNNKVVWYADGTTLTQLPANHQLEAGATYFAAQVAGDCESEVRTPVTILFETPDAPVVPENQVICEKTTLADLVVTGYGIVWYDDELGDNVLPLDTPLEVGKSYWAAQKIGNCESKRAEVTITDDCYVVYGTMFPFVYNDDASFDSQFPVTVKLHAVPEKNGNDPIGVIMSSIPVHTTNATFYDGSVHIDQTPLEPGEIGNSNNPGLKINWESIGREVGTINNTYVIPGQKPENPVGMYKFENVVPGNYILEISRPGFITRWGKVTVDVSGKTLGHRELIAGDVNGDFQVDASDISISLEPYNPIFDLNGDGILNPSDILIIQYNIKANMGTYEETLQWASEY